MLEFIEFLLCGGYEATIAIGPLALAGISAGASLLGGLASGAANRRSRVDVPPELQGQIDDLSDPNFFLDELQRAVNNDQGFFNINASMASQGVDSQLIGNERRQQLESGRQNAVVRGMDQLEGLRLNALQNALGQLNRINAQNAQLKQQQTQNTLDIISQTASGVGGSFIQGLGFQSMQNAFGSGSGAGQTGGQGISILDQFDTGGLPSVPFNGIGGNNSFT